MKEKTELEKALPKRAARTLARVNVNTFKELDAYIQEHGDGDDYCLMRIRGIGERTYKEIKEVYDERQDDFDRLPIRIRSALRRHGIKTKQELMEYFMKYGCDGIIKMRGMGAASQAEIEKVLGCSLKQEQEAQKEIEKLKRLKDKIDLQIRKLKRKKEIEYAFFKVKMISNEQEEESYEVHIKVLMDGEVKDIPILKSPNLTGVANQLMSMTNDICTLKNLIYTNWVRED